MARGGELSEEVGNSDLKRVGFPLGGTDDTVLGLPDRNLDGWLLDAVAGFGLGIDIGVVVGMVEGTELGTGGQSVG
jgi:hypothetical protein